MSANVELRRLRSSTQSEPAALMGMANSFAVTACHVAVLMISFACTLTAALQFQHTWSRKCDYDLKIWIMVTLSRLTLQMFVLLLVNNWKCPGATCVYLLLNLSDVFALAWFLYGIKPVLVDSYCNTTSHVWGVTLWSIQCVVIFLPCVLLCVLVPILFCLIRNARDEELSTAPTPDELISRLRTEKYRDIKHSMENVNDDHPVMLRSETTQPDVPAIAQVADGIRSLTGLPLPDPSRQIRRAAGPHQQVMGRSNSATGAPACPICFGEFEDEDLIVLMPCDERHAFHHNCVVSWLHKSKFCPICRTDVCEILTNQSPTSGPAPTSSGGALHRVKP